MSPVLIKYLYLNAVIFFLILYRFALYWENAEFYNIYKEHVRFSYVHSQEIHEMIFLVSSLFLSITLFYIKSKNEKKNGELFQQRRSFTYITTLCNVIFNGTYGLHTFLLVSSVPCGPCLMDGVEGPPGILM